MPMLNAQARRCWSRGSLSLLGDRMFVADQRNDRVDEIVAGPPQTFLQLAPVAGKDNVDGIGVQGDQLLVPDSPNGNLCSGVPGSGLR